MVLYKYTFYYDGRIYEDSSSAYKPESYGGRWSDSHTNADNGIFDFYSNQWTTPTLVHNSWSAIVIIV